jgi:hypothetical protein
MAGPFTNVKGDDGREEGAAKGLTGRAITLAKTLAENGFGDVRVRSGYRDPKHNERVKGAKRSQHIRGTAFDLDVSAMSEAEKARLLEVAIANGVKGIGIYPGGRTIHVDLRETTPVTWGPGADPYEGVKVSQQPAWARPALSRMMGGNAETALPGPPDPKPPVPASIPDATPVDDDFEDIANSALGKSVTASAVDAEAPDEDFDAIYRSAVGEPSAASVNPALANFEKVQGKEVGEKGLVWDKDGGRDPKTGELVIAGKPFTEPKWNAFLNLASGGLQGFGPKVMGLANELTGRGPASQAEAAYEGAREDWKTKNSGKALATDIVGSTATIAPAMIAGGAGLAAGASKIPGMAPVVNFLSGNSQGLAKIPSMVAAGATSGAVSGAASTKLGSGDPMWDAATGAAIGGVVGPVAGLVANKFMPETSSVPTREAGLAARAALREGIPVKGSQLLGAPPKNPTEQLHALTSAVARKVDAEDIIKAGNGAGFAGLDSVEAVTQNLGRKFDTALATIGDVPADNTFLSKLTSIRNNILSDGTIEPAQKKTAVGAIDLVENAVLNSGFKLTAADFQKLTHSNGQLSKLIGDGKNNSATHLADLKESMFDLVERVAPPEGVKEFAKARAYWRDWKSLENIIKTASANGGQVSPSAIAALAKKAGLSENLRDVVQSAKMVPGPQANATGEAVDKGLLGNFFVNPLGRGIGWGAGLGAGYFGAQSVPDMLRLMGQNPGTTTMGAGALLAAAAAKAGRDKYINSDKFTRTIIQNALKGKPSSVSPSIIAPTIPAAELYTREGESGEPAGPLRIVVTPRKKGE